MPNGVSGPKHCLITGREATSRSSYSALLPEQFPRCASTYSVCGHTVAIHYKS
jgi:hypothetical protein